MDLLHVGLHPGADKALRLCGVTANQIVQVIGDAPDSHGTHKTDGSINGDEYGAAIDLSVHHPKLLSNSDIEHLLDMLASHGIAGWYRHPGHDHWSLTAEAHIHCIYAGCKMKRALRDQIHQWCHDPILNGLLSGVPYAEWQPNRVAVQVVRELFLANNPPSK